MVANSIQVSELQGFHFRKRAQLRKLLWVLHRLPKRTSSPKTQGYSQLSRAGMGTRPLWKGDAGRNPAAPPRGRRLHTPGTGAQGSEGPHESLSPARGARPLSLLLQTPKQPAGVPRGGSPASCPAFPVLLSGFPILMNCQASAPFHPLTRQEPKTPREKPQGDAHPHNQGRSPH